MSLHFKHAIQINTYILGENLELEDNWRDICTAQEDYDHWKGRENVARQRYDINLGGEVDRFRRQHSNAEGQLRSLHQERDTLQTELRRARVLLNRAMQQIFQSSDAYYQWPQPRNDESAVFEDGELEDRLALLRYSGVQMRSAEAEVSDSVSGRQQTRHRSRPCMPLFRQGVLSRVRFGLQAEIKRRCCG